MVAGVAAALLATSGCSSDDSRSSPSGLAGTPSPSVPVASTSGVTPLRPVAMVGPLVYDGHRTPWDSGIRHVATYADTRGSIVIADRGGTIWLLPRGDGPARRIGRFSSFVSLMTDAERERVAWLTHPGGDDVLHVVETTTGRRVFTGRLRGSPTLLAIGADAAYVVDRGPRLLRLDYATGRMSVVRVPDASAVEDVVDAHVSVFRPGGGYVAPVDHLGDRRHVPLGADLLAPGLAYGASLEGDDVLDLHTGARVPIHVPVHGREKVAFYGWLGPSTASFEKYDLTHRSWSLFTCDLVTARCAATVTGLPDRLVSQGVWSPQRAE